MKTTIVALVATVSITANSEEPKLVLGTFVHGSISSYEPPSDCVESENVICLKWASYYLYTIKPISTASTSSTITVRKLSHTASLGPSENPLLLAVTRLSDNEVKLVGAEYELIDATIIGEQKYCMESSVKSLGWLFIPPEVPKEYTNSGGEFCYAFPSKMPNK